MRVSGWNSRNRMRPGSKHLCGQTCLHKLMDDFMARDVAARMQRGVVDEVDLDEQAVGTDASLTSDAAYLIRESPVRLPTPVAPTLPRHVAAAVALPSSIPAASTPGPAPSPLPSHAPSPLPGPISNPFSKSPGAELVSMPAKPRVDVVAAQIEEPPGFRSRNLRAEAWDRERERSMRSSERRPNILGQRRSGLS